MAATHPIGGEAGPRDSAPPPAPLPGPIPGLMAPGSMPPAAMPAGLLPVADSIAKRLSLLDLPALKREYSRQGAFLHVRDLLPSEVTALLIDAVAAVQGAVNRNYLPGHKQGGSVSRHAIDRLAPVIGDIYRAPALIAWLGQLAGERLQVSPPDDAHAYALYFYTRPGDHIGWHYDRSYYAGRRYTVLLGIVDESSCRLDYQLHTREPGATMIPGSVQIPPGGLVFFDGDKLRHRVTPLAPGERRISLTLEYLTNPEIRTGWRLISNMKDAVAYFGFRQVFGRQGKARKPRS